MRSALPAINAPQHSAEVGDHRPAVYGRQCDAIQHQQEQAKMSERILTKEVMAGIPALVAQGMNADTICQMLGCKKPTLKVRCSQEKISLRVPGSPRRRGRATSIGIRLEPPLRERFQKRANANGISEAALARALLDVIVRDDLFDAVLDTEQPKENGASQCYE